MLMLILIFMPMLLDNIICLKRKVDIFVYVIPKSNFYVEFALAKLFIDRPHLNFEVGTNKFWTFVIMSHVC